MSETKLTQEEVHERAKNIDEDIKQKMYDDATNIGGVSDIGVEEFVNKEASHFEDIVDEPEAVLRQAATNAASEAVDMIAEEGKFMD